MAKLKSMTRNGYINEPLLDTESGVCYICGFHGDCAVHEIYPGASRATSKRIGAYVWLCPKCHNLVHVHSDFAIRHLKKPFQDKYLETHSREEFRKLIGRFYD